MRKIALSLLVVFTSLLSHAFNRDFLRQPIIPEPDTLRISLITCDPGEEVYQLFGHTALRVQRGGLYPFDLAFNYGTFSFDTDNFVYKFVKGETDYKLGICDFAYFVPDYIVRGSSIVEQELNLTTQEKQQFFDLLIANTKPENIEYRYNFLFDNCATRPRDLTKAALDSCGASISFNAKDTVVTFREIIRHYAKNDSWLLFGIDLALGRELDRPATWEEQMFIPIILREACKDAFIVDADGNSRPLVKKETMLFESQYPPINPPTYWFASPMIYALMFMLFVIAVTCIDSYFGLITRWLDVFINIVFFVAGCIVYFLVFFSEHPATTFNINALWLTPLAIIPAVMPFMRCYEKVRYYHAFNLVLLTVYIILVLCGVQVIDWAFIPLVVLSASRSIYNLIHYYRCNYI